MRLKDGSGFPLRILMIAPLPFLEPRGAPFQVYHRVRCLSRLGYEIDLVTYPIGENIEEPSVRLCRAWSIPFIRSVKVGPSLAKFPLDAVLFLRAFGLLMTHRYDCIHTHLEAGLFGAILSRLFHVPHIYDMHDDLAEQLVNSKFTRLPILISLMRQVMRLTLRSARAVIIVYPRLQDTVDRLAPGVHTTLLYNTPVTPEETEQLAGEGLDSAAATLRAGVELASDRRPILLYTGTFEPYQGLDAVVDSMPTILAKYPHAVWVLVGGRPNQIDAVRKRARRLGVEDALRLPGRRPAAEMSAWMRLSDVLLSPRSEGTNTPLKLFSYLYAGRPIVASNIIANTQVLTSSTAELVEPTSEALSEGILRVLGDERRRQSLAANARAHALRNFSYQTFQARTADVYRVAMAATPGHLQSGVNTSAMLDDEYVSNGAAEIGMDVEG